MGILKMRPARFVAILMWLSLLAGIIGGGLGWRLVESVRAFACGRLGC
jgi:hypothetical protein